MRNTRSVWNPVLAAALWAGPAAGWAGGPAIDFDRGIDVTGALRAVRQSLTPSIGAAEALAAPAPQNPARSGPKLQPVLLRVLNERGYGATLESARTQRLEAGGESYLWFEVRFSIDRRWRPDPYYRVSHRFTAQLIPCSQETGGPSCRPGDAVLVLNGGANAQVSPEHIQLPADFRDKLVSVIASLSVKTEDGPVRIPFTFDLALYPLR